MIRVRNIRLAFDHDDEAIKNEIALRLGISQDAILSYRLARRSIDARSRSGIYFVYTLDVQVADDSEVLEKFANDTDISSAPNLEYRMPQVLRESEKRPLIVGAGPCGLFSALMLAQLGQRPLLIERGKDVDSRVGDVRAFWNEAKLNLESNVQFGEGGAGTFSDGKLTTQIKDKANRSRKVLEELVLASAPKEILFEAKPHIGTDKLRDVVKNIRKKIIDLGGEVRFETKLTDIKVENGAVVAAVVNGYEQIETDTIVLAIGHSARDTFELLVKLGIEIKPKPFSIGVRIEHPQTVINESQYGKFADAATLGAAEYKLVTHCANGRSAYTFCMCPGGMVVASASEEAMLVTNGMSEYARDAANANSALLVGVSVDDFGSDNPLSGVEFQRKWENKAFNLGGGNYFAPAQLVGDFLRGRASKCVGSVLPSYKPGVVFCDLSECLPDFVSETLRLAIPELEKKLKGFSMGDAVMTAIESRSSSPIRIVRNQAFESSTLKGLFPAGEGAGYAGGIISSAIDGIKVAEAIVGAL